MKRLIRTGALLAATALLCSAASGQQSDGPPPGGHPVGPREACREDAQTYCSGIKPGGGRIVDCLEDHYKQLSENCYNALQKMQAYRDKNGNNPPPPPREHDDNGPPPPPPERDGKAPPPPPDDSGAN